jgi:hypothetical protein
MQRGLFIGSLGMLALAQAVPCVGDLHTRFPGYAAYTNQASMMVDTLTVTTTNLQAFLDTYPALLDTTIALNDQVAEALASYRAGVFPGLTRGDPPVGSVDGEDRLAVAEENQNGILRRDLAGFHIFLLKDNYLVGFDDLLALTLTSLSDALARTEQWVPVLHDRLESQAGQSVPAYLLVDITGPDRAVPGEVVALTITIRNVGSQTAEGVRYRFDRSGRRNNEKLAPILLGDIAAGEEISTAFFVRLPLSGFNAAFAFTVSANDIPPAGASHGIALEAGP